MNTKEIEHNIQAIFDNFSKEEFIYDLLMAYGISKTSVTRLKKGDFNLSKNENEILYKKKIFFKVEDSNKLLSTVENVSKEERILKHKPQFAIITDYKHLVAKDLKLGRNLDIELKELPNYFDFFLPLAGCEVYNASNDNEADRNASYKMATLYDLLREENPDIYNSKVRIHNLNIFLSRLLFCYFAEDTGIFEEDSVFTNTLAQHTDSNGSDTHEFLNHLFIRLSTEKGDNFPEYLKKFPYVNGGLYKDNFRKLAKNINPYLMDASNIIVSGRRNPLYSFPEMKFGNMPNDGGGLIFTEEEYEQLEEALKIPTVANRIEKTEVHRLNSKDKGTNRLAEHSHQFRDRNTAKESLLIIPRVSSERREYIPCGYLSKDVIASDSTLVIYDAEPIMFAIINSRMHMAWVRAVGGRLKTDYRYSKDICYNTFPFPNISTKQKENLNLYVFAILDERAKHSGKTMAQLYNPDTMPKGLKLAHQELDEAIEKCYRLQPFKNDTERLEYLFKLYEEMTKKDTLFAKQKKTRKRKK